MISNFISSPFSNSLFFSWTKRLVSSSNFFTLFDEKLFLRRSQSQSELAVNQCGRSEKRDGDNFSKISFRFFIHFFVALTRHGKKKWRCESNEKKKNGEWHKKTRKGNHKFIPPFAENGSRVSEGKTVFTARPLIGAGLWTDRWKASALLFFFAFGSEGGQMIFFRITDMKITPGRFFHWIDPDGFGGCDGCDGKNEKIYHYQFFSLLIHDYDIDERNNAGFHCYIENWYSWILIDF